MKFLTDFFPIILFFLAFKMGGIQAATIVGIVATIVQVLFHWLKNKKVETMHLVSLALIVVLGGATLLSKDERFIKWKPTGLYWIFSIVFAASAYVGQRKTVLERLLSAQISLPANVWRKANWAWSIFFVLLGATNLVVAYNVSTDTWVNFKLFGLMGLTFAFVLLQGAFIGKYIKKDGAEDSQKTEVPVTDSVHVSSSDAKDNS